MTLRNTFKKSYDLITGIIREELGLSFTFPIWRTEVKAAVAQVFWLFSPSMTLVLSGD